jgi:hypothetical protein
VEEPRLRITWLFSSLQDKSSATMSIRNMMKEGWQPKGRDGGKESWRGDFKGINQVVSSKDDSLAEETTNL